MNPSRHKDCLRERIQYESFRHWFDTKDDDQPYFAYLHINNPHHPYRPPLNILKERLTGEDLSPTEAIRISNGITNDLWQAVADGCEFSPKEQRALEATYEAELTYADYIAKQVFKYAVSRDEDTVVIITGDHGEMFGENGMLGHNLVLHDGILNVPLITYGLDTGSAQSDDLIQHADVSKAILDACGIQNEQFKQAYNFTHENRDYVVAERGPRPSRADTLAERNPEFDSDSFHWNQLSMIRSRGWKYQ
uniref:sulfatase-like hydrolase/transferase n=1 Tax=Halococcus hamelinensis TaxID=332168 RepID=UPI001375F91F